MKENTEKSKPLAVVLMMTVSPTVQAIMAGPPIRGQAAGLLRNVVEQVDMPMDAATQAPETT